MGKVIAAFVVGVAAGWGASLAASGTEAPRRSGKRAEPVERKTVDLSAPEDPKETREPEERHSPDIVALLRSGSGNAIRTRLPDADPGPDWLPVIETRLAQAHGARDWRLYRALLEAAARVGTPEAHALLLAVMRNEQVDFPERMGGFFARALAESELSGIAEAARRRVERNVADGKNSWVGIDGWADLVAGHGDSAMIGWLAELEESGQFRSKAREALCRSTNPAAVEYVVAAVINGEGSRGGKSLHDGIYLKSFARTNPERALYVLEALRAKPDHGVHARTFAQAAAEAATEQTLARVQAILVAPKTPLERLEFCYAVQAIDSKGLDHSALDFLLEEPVSLLERVASGAATADESNLASKARYAIEYNPLVWSKRAVAALEKAGYPKEAAKIRNELDGEWRMY